MIDSMSQFDRIQSDESQFPPHCAKCLISCSYKIPLKWSIHFHPNEKKNKKNLVRERNEVREFREYRTRNIMIDA